MVLVHRCFVTHLPELFMFGRVLWHTTMSVMPVSRYIRHSCHRSSKDVRAGMNRIAIALQYCSIYQSGSSVMRPGPKNAAIIIRFFYCFVLLVVISSSSSSSSILSWNHEQALPVEGSVAWDIFHDILLSRFF